MSRKTFKDFRTSRIPQTLGLCAADAPSLASYCNEAIQTLLQSSGDEGWWGTFATMVFNVDPNEPYITVPREVARLEQIDVCRTPVVINNSFYEFLQFGCGLERQRPDCAGQINARCGCQDNVQGYDRLTVPTMRDITPGNKLRIYMTNGADTGKRIFFQSKDGNDKPIYTMDRGVPQNGFFMTLDNMVPFIESPMTLNSIQNVTKDNTVGEVQVYGINPSTTAQTLLSTYAPNETTPCYRRYFLSNLPSKCCDCDSPDGVVQVTAIVKLEFIPVYADTDFLLIGNLDALKNECQSIRYDEMDTQAAKQMAEYHHRNAIRLLNQELVHYLGKSRPALQFAPFGNARLENAGVGTMI